MWPFKKKEFTLEPNVEVRNEYMEIWARIDRQLEINTPPDIYMLDALHIVANKLEE